MPRAIHNISRQRSRGHAITINGLLTARARCLRDLRLSKGDPDVQSNIDAIDRVLVNVIGFTGDIAELTRDYRREALFKRGELQRMVATVLREANGPLTTRQIMERVSAQKGLTMRPGKRTKEWINRVRKVCQNHPAVCMNVVDGAQVWAVRRAEARR